MQRFVGNKSCPGGHTRPLFKKPRSRMTVIISFVTPAKAGVHSLFKNFVDLPEGISFSHPPPRE